MFNRSILKYHLFIMIGCVMLLGLGLYSRNLFQGVSQAAEDQVHGSSSVNIQSFQFSPNALTVPVNTLVTWTNNDGATHTTKSSTGVWDSGNLSNGQSFSFTFTNVGTFNYFCNIHTNMQGSIIVTGSTPTATSTATIMPSATLTPSFTPATTSTPSTTPTPSATPAITSTPSATPVVTATSTLTPSITPTTTQVPQFTFYIPYLTK